VLQWFHNAKSAFLRVNASLRWLENVSNVYGFLLVCGVWDISSSIDPFFPLAGGLCKFYTNARGKPIQRQPLLVQYKQQANPPFSFINCAALYRYQLPVHRKLIQWLSGPSPSLPAA
jgi:hypothetical protein